ncbi:MAG TPA: decarboxylating 6-phosphogluconate dehydrogenase [Candidatus Saccharimonadales bacterium]|nr:decarboxylating 6-phosphogluconate dehydrogenase [Candidatus Saccharimonadales bacterium]
MELGMVGLGKMGKNMALRLLREEHRVVAWNRSPGPVQEVVAEGAEGAKDLADLVAKLPAPRVVWLMVPAGKVTATILQQVSALLSEGDIVVDGGNSNFRDSMRRADELRSRGIRYLDAGTSGGVWGLQVGYCLMVGGDRSAFDIVAPALKTLAPPDGFLYTGPAGSGHYTKMVHNGIEYGMMQAYAEGFELLQESGFGLDLRAISHLWNQGSVIRSWLLDLAEDAFEKDRNLEQIQGFVDDSGEGRWTVKEAIDRAVPAPVIALSVLMRFRSRQQDSFSMKVLAALRNEFGGHAVKATGQSE